jgi:hypothetical protein
MLEGWGGIELSAAYIPVQMAFHGSCSVDDRAAEQAARNTSSKSPRNIQGAFEVVIARLVNDRFLSIRSIDNRYRYRIVINRF